MPDLNCLLDGGARTAEDDFEYKLGREAWGDDKLGHVFGLGTGPLKSIEECELSCGFFFEIGDDCAGNSVLERGDLGAHHDGCGTCPHAPIPYFVRSLVRFV